MDTRIRNAVVMVLAAGGLSALSAGSPTAGWTVLGPGGGGAQYLPAISPHDPNLVLAACDMTGSYISRNGGGSWRMFNLRGRTHLFAFDPKAPGTLYASGIGLYRSIDGGERWNLIYPRPRDVVKVVSRGDHAEDSYETASGPVESITAFAVDPDNSKTLYAAFRSEKTTVLKVSTDWGGSWTAAGQLSDGARAIFVDPHSPLQQRTLFVAGSTRIAVRENGAWRAGVPAPGEKIQSVSGGFGQRGGKPILYVATPAGLAVSSDGGASWRPLLPGLGVRAVAASLKTPEAVYASFSGLKADGKQYFGVATSRNAGQSWSYPWREADRAAPNVDVGGWINPALGPGWGENPLELGVSPLNPDVCYGTDMGRTLKTSDGGKTWQAVYTRKAGAGGYTTTGLDVTTAYGVHFDPFDAKHMFISYTDIGLFRSDDGGASWRRSVQGVPRAWTNTTYWLEFDPEVKGRIWAVMSGTHDLPRPKMWRRAQPATFKGGVCRSDDGGATWTPQTGLPLTAATHILLDRRSPKHARVLYVTGFGRGVYKSVDGGATWSLKNNGLPAHEPFAWRLSQAGTGALYLVLARRSDDGSIGNDRDGALYRSTDAGEHWGKIKLPDGVNGPMGLQIDPRDERRLYLATWGRDGQDTRSGGGVYISSNGGATWKQALGQDGHIYDVTIDPRNPTHLYACGFESSLWRSVDRGETWTRVRGYNFKWGHRVIVDPVHAGSVFVTTFGGSVWHGPAAGDPSSIEDIVTPAAAFTHGKR